MLEYTIYIRKRPDQSYIASCPLFPEAHAQGQTFDECLDNIKEMLALCIRHRREQHQEIPDESEVLKMTVVI